MIETNYDVVLIGSSHATWHTATILNQAGKSVALIERDTNRLSSEPAELLAQLQDYRDQRLTTAAIDWKSFRTYKQHVIDPLPRQMTTRLTQAGIAVFHGSAVLMGNHCIQINGEVIRAAKIVIGTGRHSKRLQISGWEFMHDSHDLLNLSELPAHVTFIGASMASLKFAALIMELGAQVTIIDHDSHMVNGFNSSQASKLIAKMEAAGAKFYFNDTAHAIAITPTGYKVITSNGANLATGYVLNMTDREPNVTHLGLENAGIYSNPNDIAVDDHLRANGDNIYAIGDVIAKQRAKVTPAITVEATYVANQILGDTAPITDSSLTTAI
ncbi:FAD-dependent oxidoreductase [Levilactobacillus enshiensis]|uniref:FAD-dependent oxidoreductase n=1 Tax=Levilactobacillus enshiensis TaxID=2590213 RepID=UPI00117A460E|nr:FAD-dependent oxidoreductase [Levilactobacillus enshiensis]